MIDPLTGVARRAASLWLACAIALAGAGCATTGAGVPENIHFSKQRLIEYQKSGRYEADIGRVAGDAANYLRTRLAQGGKNAVVFDIDETALSNYPALKANDFGWIPLAPCKQEADGKLGSPCGLLTWIMIGVAEPIKPIRELYNVAREAGAAVFFVTGRPDTPEMRAATEKNLRAAGYPDWAGLSLKPTAQKMTTVEYKSGERRKFTEQGFAIIATIGDQQSDLDGGYAERGFLVPNPFYFIP